MLVFLDFEASSLAKLSYPIEVGWVFEDGTSAEHLIRPAPDWTDWDDRAEAIHGITRAELAKATPHEEVARVMVEQLTDHDLLASAPSWDGKWLSTLLRAAGYPRHTLRLRDSDDAQQEVAEDILSPVTQPEKLQEEIANLLALAKVRGTDAPPAHRALADAQAERDRWCTVRKAALARAAALARDAPGSRKADDHPVTPDGRYFVVRGRLWRMSNPALSEERRAALVKELMTARRAVGLVRRTGDEGALDAAHKAVDWAE